MTLPRELKPLLEEPSVDGAVQRTWVRLERSRARRPSPRRLAVLSTALAAAVLGFLASRTWAPAVSPRPGIVSAPSATPQPGPKRLVPERTEVAAAPAPLASAMLQGRARRVARRVSADDQPADPVGHLLEGAVEAFTDGDTARAAALLTRVTGAFPDDPRVPEALVTLGWLQLEHLDAPLDARMSLERAMESSLSQELFDRAWPLLQRAQALAPQRPD